MREGYRLPENNYSQQAIDFMDKVLEISGLGDYTFLPDGEPTSLPMTITMIPLDTVHLAPIQLHALSIQRAAVTQHLS